MKISRFLLAPVAAALLGAAAPPAPVDEAAAQRVRADVEFLASDLLEGRDTGSRGHGIAAAFVASQFRSIGLKPGGTDGNWYQQVPFRRAVADGDPKASLTIGKEVVPLVSGTDISVAPSVTQKVRNVEAPLVFVGHGISDRRAGIDDYEGLDVRGKLVVVLQGTPEGLPSEISAHLAAVKALTASSKGAAGLIQISGTGARSGPHLARLDRPVVDWVGPAGQSSESSRLGLQAAISRAVAERLFAAAGQDLSKIVAAKAQSVRGFELPARLSLEDRMQWEDFSSPQVIGMLAGTDPALKDEYVVLMAHLDHLGVRADAKPGEDRIYNGALDNAAGVATMLEAAREFAKSGKPPRRSVLFIANTGEERGLRGADYFAAHPTVAADKMVGLVDLDMPMLLYEFTDVIAFGGNRSTIARTIADAAGAMEIKVSADPMPEEAIFVRSDHYRFVTRGIPAILLMTGYANGGEAKWKEFLGTIYHQPHDDVSLPIRWDQGARYAELNYRIARALADADQRPMWYESDYFGETFAPGQPRAKR